MQNLPSDPPGRNLVFICDGTLSSIRRGEETNAGRLYRLLAMAGQTDAQRFEYDRGVQGIGLRKWLHAASGEGINLSIMRGYGFLASQYRAGDRIFLFGYSRGAYAVRSLAGLIGSIGLLRPEYATERHVRLAFRFYETGSRSVARREFARRRCHEGVAVEMLGVWDTVKSLGLPYPIVNRLAAFATDFHDHRLGPHIRHGYHALALDEDRTSFAPILWEQSEDWKGRLEQTWFAGAHADIGGEIRSEVQARKLANIPLNWMLRRALRHGLLLPEEWEAQQPEDPAAPMVGARSGIARFFILRAPRIVGAGDGEVVHLSVRDRMRDTTYQPTGLIGGLPEGD